MKRRIISAILAASVGVGALGVFSSSAAAELSLKASSLIVYDEEIGYYKGIDIGSTASELAESFTEAVVIRDSKGNEVDPAAKIGTDYTVNSGDISRKVVVYGDVNRDSSVNTTDAVLMLRRIADWDVDINETAADTKPDGKINTTDAVTLLRYLAGWGVTLGYAPVKPDLSKQTAPGEDGTLDLFFASNMDMYSDADTADTGKYGYKMELAKNEIEFCQAILTNKTEHTGLNVTVSDFTNADGTVLPTEVRMVRYWTMYNSIFGEKRPTSDKTYPEELVPLQKDFTVAADKSQSIIVKVRSAADQPAGLYRSTLNVTDSEGKVIKTANLYANVWNFALPEATSCKTAFGFTSYSFYVYLKTYTDPGRELYRKYYDFFLENRINAWCMPFSPIEDEADEFMNDPRVNTFLVSGGYGGQHYGFGDEFMTPEYLTAAYEKISANPEWAKKAIFYLDDEPQNIETLNSIRNHKNVLDTYYPGARIIVPNAYEIDFGEFDTFGHLAENTTVICPQSWYFSEEEIKLEMDIPNKIYHGIGSKYTEEIEKKYGSFYDRYEALRKEGKEMWWYTAAEPYSPFCNISLHHDLVESRTTFWQQYANDADGILYWSATDWSHMNYRKAYIDNYSGTLVFANPEDNNPNPTIHLETARDGIEDFEYLSMIERYKGRDEAEKFSREIVNTIIDFNRDPEKLFEVRRAMADVLTECAKTAWAVPS